MKNSKSLSLILNGHNADYFESNHSTKVIPVSLLPKINKQCSNAQIHSNPINIETRTLPTIVNVITSPKKFHNSYVNYHFLKLDRQKNKFK